MRWNGPGYRSCFTVTLLLRDQFDLSQLVACKPCDQLDVQPWGARVVVSEEGKSGLGMDAGYALQVVVLEALTETPPDRSGPLVEIHGAI